MPPDDAQMRASDADRDRASALLREHHAAGRLTLDEFQDRLDAVYAAKTLGELDEVMADLPKIDLYRLPEANMREAQASRPDGSLVAPGPHGRLSPAWRGAWASWASVSLVLFVIWLIGAVSSHSAEGVWFLWVAGPWGALLLGRWMFGGHPGGGHPGGSGHGPGGHRPGGVTGQRPVAELHGDQNDPVPGLDSQAQHQEERIRHHEERMQRQRDRMEERMRRHEERHRPPRE